MSIPLARRNMANSVNGKDKGRTVGAVGVGSTTSILPNSTTTGPSIDAAEVDGAVVGPAPEKFRQASLSSLSRAAFCSASQTACS